MAGREKTTSVEPKAADIIITFVAQMKSSNIIQMIAYDNMMFAAAGQERHGETVEWRIL